MDAPTKLPTVSLDDLELLAVRQALAESDENRTRAARALGRSVRWLQRYVTTTKFIHAAQKRSAVV